MQYALRTQVKDYGELALVALVALICFGPLIVGLVDFTFWRLTAETLTGFHYPWADLKVIGVLAVAGGWLAHFYRRGP